MKSSLIRQLAVAAAALGLLGGAALAADRSLMRGNDAVITVCAKKNGQIRLVPGPAACRRNEVAVRWNATGLAGTLIAQPVAANAQRR